MSSKEHILMKRLKPNAYVLSRKPLIYLLIIVIIVSTLFIPQYYQDNHLFQVKLQTGPSFHLFQVAEKAKANRLDFYRYIEKQLTEWPNVPFHQDRNISDKFIPGSTSSQSTCGKSVAVYLMILSKIYSYASYVSRFLYF